MLPVLLQEHSWSAQAACEVEAACHQAGETVYLLVGSTLLKFCSGLAASHTAASAYEVSSNFMQALALCQQGKDEQAERILARMGSSHRLAPAIMNLNALPPPASEVTVSLGTSLPSLTPNAVPGALMETALHAYWSWILSLLNSLHDLKVSEMLWPFRWVVPAVETRLERIGFILDRSPLL